jgi:predicted nucleotidyltransferase
MRGSDANLACLPRLKNPKLRPWSRKLHSLAVDKVIDLPKSVARFLSSITADSRIDRISIFGSRAVGDNDVRADCDVAIHAPALTRAQFARLRVAASETKSLYWISLVHFDRTPRELQQRILGQGVTFYERAETARQPRES